MLGFLYLLPVLFIVGLCVLGAVIDHDRRKCV